MRKNNKLSGTYFCGNEASDYAKENGFLDYATLANAFDAVLNNGIIQATSDIGYWGIENGSEEYYEDNNGNRYAYDEKEERIEELEEKIEELEELETEESEAQIEEIREEIEKYFDEDAMKTENLFRYLITKHFYEMLAEA